MPVLAKRIITGVVGGLFIIAYIASLVVMIVATVKGYNPQWLFWIPLVAVPVALIAVFVSNAILKRRDIYLIEVILGLIWY